MVQEELLCASVIEGNYYMRISSTHTLGNHTVGETIEAERINEIFNLISVNDEKMLDRSASGYVCGINSSFVAPENVLVYFRLGSTITRLPVASW